MKNLNSSAFRRSLEDRIRAKSRETGIPISRYRKLIAFNRFLARLVIADPKGWVLKGGYMMELQFHQKARSTKDIDLLFTKPSTDIHRILSKACKVPLEDGFSFEVGRAVSRNQGEEKTHRYPITALLDSRTFETFQIDINQHDLLIKKPVLVVSNAIVKLPEFPAFRIPCYSLEQQIAEKLHALSRTYASGETSRVKDLVDILLIASTKKLRSNSIRKAILSTFLHRNTHDIPLKVPKISSEYAKNYAKLAMEIGIKQRTLDEANAAFEVFMTPILSPQSTKTWDPNRWKWLQEK